jgi:hypothetical protein
MSEVVRHLPNKHKALNSNPSITKRKKKAFLHNLLPFETFGMVRRTHII